jgi:polyisoprenoid-binding protein YceI
MPIPPGTHRFGPGNATLSVKTGRTGAAAKAGHNLLIHVTAWSATLEVGADDAATSIALEADASSLRVRDGTGGIQALGDDDKANIEQTIDDEILKRTAIEFRSTDVQTSTDGSRLNVQGELTLVGTTAPIAFDVAVGAGDRLSASAVVKQTDWGITPYSTLFGTLKVVDAVEVSLDAVLGAGEPGGAADLAEAPSSETVTARRMHLRAPSIHPGVTSFLWALTFFLFLWLGMLAIGVSGATALIFALVAGFLIFVFVRTQGAGRKP